MEQLNETELLKQQIVKAKEQFIKERIQKLEAILQRSKEIIDSNIQIDNAAENYTVCKSGERYNIVEKQNIYYLQNKQTPTAPLFYPCYNRNDIETLWIECEYDTDEIEQIEKI